jgi:antitoxin component YwqK of YwqJK toxin-antitoxin module
MMRGKPYTKRHVDGSVWAKGRLFGGEMDGRWQWFRRDGTRVRVGRFDRGRRIGKWTTYDRKGRSVKVRMMKPVSRRRRASA